LDGVRNPFDEKGFGGWGKAVKWKDALRAVRRLGLGKRG